MRQVTLKTASLVGFAMGAQSSWYPTSDVISVGPNGTEHKSNFEYGSTYWTRSAGAIQVTRF